MAVRTYTITEAAELTGLTRKALARRVERGSLRSVVRDGRRKIPRSELVRAGLLQETGDVGAPDFDPRALLLPRTDPENDPDATQVRPEEALAAVFRELLDRFERQAGEIAQFRALTMQAESLRTVNELADLRVRIAELEQQPAEKELARGAGELGQRLTELSQRVEDLSKRELWLPPHAEDLRPDAAPKAEAKPDPEVIALSRRLAQLEGERHARRLGPSRTVRFVAEAAFIVGIAVVAWRMDLAVPAIVAAMTVAWAVVAGIEWASWKRAGE